jgi:two-component system, response regulator / RNA-binding antiterminator
MKVLLRILLVTGRHERALLMEQTLTDAHHQVTAVIRPDDDLLLYVQQAHPDALIIDLVEPTPDILQALHRLDEQQPLPVVVFADRSDSQAIRMAVKAGVSAYVVDGFRPARVVKVLEAACARFQEFQALRGERDRAQAKLAERKNIERAKGILMRRRALAEEAAFRLLRKMAMDRGRQLAEVAESIITAEELLAQG